MDKEKPKIFISYSWEDKAISRKLAENLRRDGAQIWIDYSEKRTKKFNFGRAVIMKSIYMRLKKA